MANPKAAPKAANPRRRKRRRNPAVATVENPRRRRRRRNPAPVVANKRRRRRNPRNEWASTMQSALAVLGGMYTAQGVPALALQRRNIGPIGYLASGVSAVGGGMLVKRFAGSPAAKLFTIAGVAATLDRIIKDQVPLQTRAQFGLASRPGISARFPPPSLPPSVPFYPGMAGVNDYVYGAMPGGVNDYVYGYGAPPGVV